MRQKSNTRRKREAEAKPVRDSIKAIGHCEICKTTRGKLDVHEICRGVYRAAALDKPFALLLVCRRCHSEKLSSASEWPESRQLALLLARRPKDFDLTAYLQLTSPRAMRRIEMEEVLAWGDEDA